MSEQAAVRRIVAQAEDLTRRAADDPDFDPTAPDDVAGFELGTAYVVHTSPTLVRNPYGLKIRKSDQPD
jgi:hypothetical protein